MTDAVRDIDELAALAVRALVAGGVTVATAESLTGGLLSAALTSVPGASTVVRGGVVVYATDLKARLAGVDPGLLDRRGPVDPEVAMAMALGVRRRLGAGIGMATTGVAGPDRQGGQEPGTVHVAVTTGGTGVIDSRVGPRRLTGDRTAIREASVRTALHLLMRVLATGESRTAPQR